MTERELAYRAKMQAIFPNYMTHEQVRAMIARDADDLIVKSTQQAIERAEAIKTNLAKYKKVQDKELWMDYQE
jgi:hypothetical protein